MVTYQFTCTKIWLQDSSLIKITSLTCSPLLDIAWDLRNPITGHIGYCETMEVYQTALHATSNPVGCNKSWRPNYGSRDESAWTFAQSNENGHWDYESVINCFSCYEQPHWSKKFIIVLIISLYFNDIRALAIDAQISRAAI